MFLFVSFYLDLVDWYNKRRKEKKKQKLMTKGVADLNVSGLEGLQRKDSDWFHNDAITFVTTVFAVASDL